MKDFFKINLNTILIAILFILWWTEGCNNPNNTAPTQDTIRTETVLRYDTVIHEVLTHRIFYSDTGFVVMPETPDSDAAVKDYFTQHPFVDSLENDSIKIAYSGYIWKGSIFNPSLNYLWKMPVSETRNTVLESTPARKLSLGAFAGYSDKPMVGALAVYTDRRDRSFIAGYGINQTLIIGVTGKIKLRK